MKTLLRILFLGFVTIYFSGCASIGPILEGMGDGLKNSSKQSSTYNCNQQSYGGGYSTVQCQSR